MFESTVLSFCVPRNNHFFYWRHKFSFFFFFYGELRRFIPLASFNSLWLVHSEITTKKKKKKKTREYKSTQFRT